ncbi:MAG: TIGR00300 family protein [Actinomycetota bacterium]|nr:TIGR00300 family protein [Actinomycetota bacterium]
MPSETVRISGHIIDTGQLARVLDTILEHDADYEIAHIEVGKRRADESEATLVVTADSEQALDGALATISKFGAATVQASDARIVPADLDSCFPAGFYSTTNLPTQVRVDGHWLDVARPEMDCGIRIVEDGAAARPETVPMLDVRAGDRVVVGFEGVRVLPERSLPAPGQPRQTFTFMSSQVSTEKPQRLLVRRVAEGMRACRTRGAKICWVAGPALVHTGSVPAAVALVRAGWVQILFAGNALPTHDIEANLHGTSLGISQTRGVPTEHGHSNHIRAINAVRRAGSIAEAVERKVVTGGLMHACSRQGVELVLAGSVRDDGPLPDVLVDVVAAQMAMRRRIPEIGFCLVLCTMLHGIAVGNLLPADVPLVCVDINPATVTKLADRGSAQALGVVTDVGLFLAVLAEELAPVELGEELSRADAHVAPQARR